MKAFFKRFSKREKVILYASIAFVFIAMVDQLILSPIIKKLANFEEEIKTTEYEMTKNMKIIRQRQRIESEEKKYSAFIVEAKSKEEEKAMFLKEIENIANMTGVHLNNLKTQEMISLGAVNRFPLNISCEAEIDQLLSFLYAIENSQMIIQIGGFQINPKSRQSSLTNCELMIYKIAIP